LCFISHDDISSRPPVGLQALLNASHKYHDAVHAFKRFGIVVDNVKIDWAAMQKQKDTAVAGLTKGVEGLFKKNKASMDWWCAGTLCIT
jgi:pyruvate/2-oxoglutarate dehydrogenase complex dihydrolipoamide dehydrogenase (E3) component